MPNQHTANDPTVESEPFLVQPRTAVGNEVDVEKNTIDEPQVVEIPAKKHGADKPEGLVQRLVLQIDERVSVKLLMRVWGPRFEFVVRLMLVATFLEDSFRTVTHFSGLTNQLAEQGCLKWLLEKSPNLASVIAFVALGIGLLAQLLGSIWLLALIRPDGATMALIGWAIAQPVLYDQLSNFELVSESLSLVGGLLMLRAHLVFGQARYGCGARTQLLGRLLLPSMYLYHAGLFLFSAITLDETNSLATYVSSLSVFVVSTAVLIGLVIGSALVAAGLKSRIIALLLALVNLGFVFYQHPFFRFVWLEDGEWKYDVDNMSFPDVALPTDINPSDFDPGQIFDLHRYYFFLGLSISGALLLLAQYGPGEIAVQKDEVLLPVVARAQD